MTTEQQQQQSKETSSPVNTNSANAAQTASANEAKLTMDQMSSMFDSLSQNLREAQAISQRASNNGSINFTDFTSLVQSMAVSNEIMDSLYNTMSSVTVTFRTKSEE